jgi:hypothetical protein
MVSPESTAPARYGAISRQDVTPNQPANRRNRKAAVRASGISVHTFARYTASELRTSG